MQTLEAVDVRDRRVLVRVDFNVPLESGAIVDDARLVAALPTLRYLLERNCRCVLMTHIGRPRGEPIAGLRTAPVAQRLSELLPDRDVRTCDEVVGEKARTMAEALGPGTVLLLENLRFHPGERSNDPEFAAALARLGDVYVNDAFAACHRKHASVYGMPQQFRPDARAIGFLVARETKALREVIDTPARPFVAIFGGAKIADKLPALDALAGRADRVLVGGAMSYTFLKALGQEVGDSKVENDQLEAARRILDRAGNTLALPDDHILARGPEQQREHRVSRTIAAGWSALDIGPETVSRYRRTIQEAGTVLWNGPMGKFEERAFSNGSRSLAEAIADSDATTVVGGGETGQLVRQLGLADRLTHLSTGGGSFLAFIAEGSLPALDILNGTET